YVVAPNYAMKAGGLASGDTAAAIAAVDAEIGRLVDTLLASKRYDDTLLVITSDHGNSDTPVAIAKSGPGSIVGFLVERSIPVVHATADNVLLVYLADRRRTAEAVALLTSAEARARFGIDRIMAPDELRALGAFGDDQMPDLVILPRSDVVYTKLPATKRMEHGGLNAADRRVPLLVVGPGARAGATSCRPVQT